VFDDSGKEIEITEGLLFDGPRRHHGDIVIVARVTWWQRFPCGAVKLCVQDRCLFQKCALGQKARHRYIGLFEKLGKLFGGEGANRELPAWDELGMGAEFEDDLRCNIRNLPFDGGWIKEMDDIRVVLIDREFPEAFGTERFDEAFTQAKEKRASDVYLARLKHLGEESGSFAAR